MTKLYCDYCRDEMPWPPERGKPLELHFAFPYPEGGGMAEFTVCAVISYNRNVGAKPDLCNSCLKAALLEHLGEAAR